MNLSARSVTCVAVLAVVLALCGTPVRVSYAEVMERSAAQLLAQEARQAAASRFDGGADFIFVRGNRLDNVMYLQNVERVITPGVVFEPAAPGGTE
jgi:hypothetical protein